MSRYRSTPLRNHLPGRTIVIACVAAIVVATPARAGLGDLAKKAKDKAAKAAGPTAAPESPTDEGRVEYDDVVLELTNARLERILAAFKAAHDLGAGRPAIVEKLNRASDERNALIDKHWPAIEARRVKRGEVEVCYHDGYQQAQDRRTEEYKDKALSDPAIREKFMRAAQENNAAAARGDSAAIKRIMQTIHEVTAPTRDDSIEVRRSCGPIPARLPAEDRLDALDEEIASLQGSIREIDGKVAGAQAKEGGLDERQWAMALERIEMYLAWKRSKPPANSTRRMFSDAEIEALEKHLERLRAALG